MSGIAILRDVPHPWTGNARRRDFLEVPAMAKSQDEGSFCAVSRWPRSQMDFFANSEIHRRVQSGEGRSSWTFRRNWKKYIE